jgi:hypothetical protein
LVTVDVDFRTLLVPSALVKLGDLADLACARGGECPGREVVIVGLKLRTQAEKLMFSLALCVSIPVPRM